MKKVIMDQIDPKKKMVLIIVITSELFKTLHRPLIGQVLFSSRRFSTISSSLWATGKAAASPVPSKRNKIVAIKT
jgi:hypothetical protein